MPGIRSDLTHSAPIFGVRSVWSAQALIHFPWTPMMFHSSTSTATSLSTMEAILEHTRLAEVSASQPGGHCFEVQFYNSGGVSGVNLHLPDGVTYACPASTVHLTSP